MFLDTGYVEAARAAAAASQGYPEPAGRPVAEDVLRARGDLAGSLARLFAYSLPVADADVASADRGAVQAAFDTGLLARLDDGRLIAPHVVTVMYGAVVVSDRPDAGSDAVMRPGPTTEQLLRVLPVDLTGRLLDVGTGPGTLALVAARRGATVTATDVSERAVAFARFNAVLNDVPLDVRLGDLDEPVAGERFEWVVSQPPFVPQPPQVSSVRFLHGGGRGDELVRRLIAVVPNLLTDEGTAFVRTDLPLAPDAAARTVRSLVGERAVVSLWTWPGLTREQLAMAYATVSDAAYGPVHAETVGAYLEHLERIGVEATTSAIVVVEKSSVGRSDAHVHLAEPPGDATWLSGWRAGSATEPDRGPG
jgi:SAM-dependent methyltransferase